MILNHLHLSSQSIHSITIPRKPLRNKYFCLIAGFSLITSH